MTQRSEEIRQEAREAFEKFWISTNNSNFFADRQISITDLKTVAFESWIMATAFAESLLSGGADSGTPAEATPDNYVAWCRYIRTGDFTRIETCDSDASGAFKVYRGAANPAQPVQNVETVEVTLPRDEHFAQASTDVRLAIIYEMLKELL